MSDRTGIQWTDATWNPVVGCTRVSAGCDSCYAVKQSYRLERMGQARYAGLTVLNGKGDRHFSGVVRTVPEALEVPLRWRKPRMVFVNSMSDLFHRDVPFDFIDRVFAVMALCPQHTFQILTKRPERMAEYLSDADRKYAIHAALDRLCSTLDDRTVPGKLDPLNGRKFIVSRSVWASAPAFATGLVWPLPNVWLLTSTESQRALDARLPHLLRCPAVVRGLSCEPLLGEIDLIGALCACADEDDWMEAHEWAGECDLCGGDGVREYLDAPDEWGEDCPSEQNHLIACRGCAELQRDVRLRLCGRAGLHWVIVGCESLPGKRCGRVDGYERNARNLIEQCRATGVPCFHKQMPVNGRVGGDPSEWPEGLRVREFPDRVESDP